MVSNHPTTGRDPAAREILGDRLHISSRRILVVDDETDICNAFQMFLEGCLSGVSVETAGAGEAAIQRLDSQQYDLIIADYCMGEVDGGQVLAHARAVQPDAPRIMVTAFPDLDVALSAVNEGAVEQFLPKPVAPMRLVELVYDLLQERRQQQEREEAYRRALDLLGPGGQADPGGEGAAATG